MPTPCVVPQCSGGADSGRFGFPTDPEINLKWRIAIKKEVESTATSSSGGPQRILWKPSNTSKICGAHFKPDDFRDTYANMYSAEPTVIHVVSFFDYVAMICTPETVLRVLKSTIPTLKVILCIKRLHILRIISGV